MTSRKFPEALRPYLWPAVLSPIVLWGPWIFLFHEEGSHLWGEGLGSFLGFWLAIPIFGPVVIWLMTRAESLNGFPEWLNEQVGNSLQSILDGTLSLYHLFWSALTLTFLGAMIYLGGRGRWWMAAVLVTVGALAYFPIRVVLW